MAAMSRLTHRMHTARVIRVNESFCDVWHHGAVTSLGFAATFPSPRAERVSPGHLVAIATWPDGRSAVVWRWYDAVVLGPVTHRSVPLWEPAHGEVVAHLRSPQQSLEPGSRVWASAGLPGAEWWVAAGAEAAPETAEVELEEVDALYTGAGLWERVFEA